MSEESEPLLLPVISPITEPVSGDLANTAAVETQTLTPLRTRTIVLALYLGSFLAALDTTIVATLLPTIASDLDASSQMSWIATSYLLSCSAFQPLYGKLSDIFGRKMLLLWSNAVFAIGCVICGSPWTNNVWVLSAGRFIAGIGGGGLSTLSTITTSDIIPLRQRGVYQGLGNIVFSFGCASGSILGALLQQGIGWRWAFLIQVPLALLSFVLVATILNLPAKSPGRGLIFLERDQGNKLKWSKVIKMIDFVGGFTLISSMLLLMIAITFLNDVSSLSVMQWVLLLASLVIFVGLFIQAEMTAANPVVPLNLLFENRTVLASSLTNWFCTMATFSIMYYIPVFWQAVYHFDPWQISLRSISNFLGISMGSLLSGIYMKRTGKYWKYSTFVNSFFVLGTFSLFLSAFRSREQGVLEFVLMFLPGFGYATMLTVTLLALIASVDFSHQAQVTSIQYAFRATGSTLGVALAGLLYQWGLQHKLDSVVLADKTLLADYGLRKLTKWCSQILKDNMFDTSFDERLTALVHGSFMFSSQCALAFAATMAILGLTTSLFMREHTLHTSVPSK